MDTIFADVQSTPPLQFPILRHVAGADNRICASDCLDPGDVDADVEEGRDCAGLADRRDAAQRHLTRPWLRAAWEKPGDYGHGHIAHAADRRYRRIAHDARCRDRGE